MLLTFPVFHLTAYAFKRCYSHVCPQHQLRQRPHRRRRGVVRGVSRTIIIDMLVIAEGLCSESFSNMIRSRTRYPQNHFPSLSVFVASVLHDVMINRTEDQTLEKVGLNLRDDVFAHDQLYYVGLSRTTERPNIQCLVQPERMINNIPHIHIKCCLCPIHPCRHRRTTPNLPTDRAR